MASDIDSDMSKVTNELHAKGEEDDPDADEASGSDDSSDEGSDESNMMTSDIGSDIHD